MNRDRFVLSAIIVALCIILALAVICKFVLPKDVASVHKRINGDFSLLVGRKPYFVRGVVYQPIPIGHNHQYDFWSDPNEPWMEDGRLMRAMGINTVRFFQPGKDAEHTRNVIRKLYQNYGIRTIMGHWMDYWIPGNYVDPKYREDLARRVLEMVKTYKDEQGMLMWILGNENNLSWHSGARIPWSCPQVEEIKDPGKRELAKARIYYSLINEIAIKIKKIDPKHIVALGNADTYTLEIAKEVCPDIDLVAVTAYRGKTFGNLWRDAKRKIDKPVLIMEFGCDSFNAKTAEEDQKIQSVFLTSQWEDIQRNRAGKLGAGNSVGGCIFEWNDEWWKHDEHMVSSWYVHNTEGDWFCGGYYFDIGAPANLNVNEEWWGIVALSPKLEKGINMRLPRQVYYDLQQMWKK